MKKIKVLFVGSNPSTKSPDETAFHPLTKSRSVIDSWIYKFKFPGNHDISFTNIYPHKKADNKPLTMREIRGHLPETRKFLDHYRDYKIIALGKTSAKILNMLDVNFFEAPHPSGLNRKLNDKDFVRDMINRLEQFIMS